MLDQSRKNIVRGPLLIPDQTRGVTYYPDGALVGGPDGKLTFTGDYKTIAHAVDPKQIRLSDGVILPPLLDIHIHIPQHPIRGRFVEGVPEDATHGKLLAGLQRNVFPAEARCDLETFSTDVVKTFLADTLSHGVVGGAAYMTVSALATEIALTLLPDTWSVGLVLMNQNCPENLRTDQKNLSSDIARLAKKFGRRLIVTDRFAVAVDTPLRQQASRLARQFGLRTQTHLNEQVGEKAIVEKTLYPHARSYTDVYLQDGLLNHQCIAAHCIEMTDDEWGILRDSGSVIAHCPTSNLLLGSGVMPLEEVLRRDLPFAIATDVGASPTVSMLAEMKRFMDVHREKTNRATAEEALYRSTIAPAELLGLGSKLGRLEAGLPMSFIEVQPNFAFQDIIASSVIQSLMPADLNLPAPAVNRVTLAGETIFERSQAHADRIGFYLNGRLTEVAGDDVFLTLSDYLRRRAGLMGTKVVCAEGDCGSCTVLIGRLEGDRLTYAAVTSCIQILFQLDAAHVITIEGLKEGQALNSLQSSMVSCHGTQCGFCTPGFVVSMYGLMAGQKAVSAEDIRRGLTGNLCRCTGYDSILRAAMSTDLSSLKSIDALFPPARMLESLKNLSADEVLIQTASKRFYKPVTLQQATQFRLENPACSVIAGGTDLGVVYNKKTLAITVALSLGGIQESKQISVDDGAMNLGSGATLTQLQTISQEHLPELANFMEWFGSPLIRNAGTIGGNLVTGSPIGDTLPAMIALAAEIEITGVAGKRRVPISQFYTGYRKTVLAEDELVSAIRVPLLKADESLKLYKVSRRKAMDISSFGAAIWVRMATDRIDDIRLAFGGVGPMVLRLIKTETFLRNQEPTLARFEQAAEIAAEEVTPITDVRGSATYRRTLAGNILVKYWHEVMSESQERKNGTRPL